MTLCRPLRAAGVWAPVLMLTARDDIGDRVRGLDAGADDYLVKPFSLLELAARLPALARDGMSAVTCLALASCGWAWVHRVVQGLQEPAS